MLNGVPDSLSVNEAIEQLIRLDGEPVAVHGILRYEFEHIAIWHYPKAEQHDDDYGSCIWLSTGSGSVQLNHRGLERLNGHRVSVMGTLHAPDVRLGGCGHMSTAPAEIMVSSIDGL